MYNLGEKKSFINDLASKLLGGQAILGTGHHHHRNLTTQVLSLEDLVLFKIQEFRLQFLAKCLQIHTLSGKNHLVLSLTHFDLLTDVLRVILREANNQEDHLSIRMVYLVSELSGTYLGHGGQGGHLFLRTLKMALSKHEAWQNLGFYEHVLDECVARDKQHWMHLQGPLSEILSFEIHNEEIIALLLSFRFKALLGAIEQLKMGEEGGQVKEGLIEGLLDYCRRVHGVEFERGQVMGPLETPFMLWLLDVAVRAWQLPKLEEGGAGGLEKGDASQSRGSSCSGSRGGGVETYVQTMRRRSSLSSMACSTTAKSSVSNMLRWAIEVTTRAAHGSSLGFSIHHELLRFVLDRLAANPQKINLLSQSAFPSSGNDNCRSSSSNNGSRSDSGLCLCGRSRRVWRVLGGYGEQLENIRRFLPLLLCEGCFRTVCHDRSMELLRPQQTVGMAPLPASEIWTPMSISEFVFPRPCSFSVEMGQRLPSQCRGERETEKKEGLQRRISLSSSSCLSNSGSSSGSGSSARGSGVEAAAPVMTPRMPTIHSMRSSKCRLSSSSTSSTSSSPRQARRPSEQQLAPGRRKRSEDVGCSYSSKPSSLAATTAATGAGDDSSPPYHAQSRRYRSSSSVSSTSSSSASPRNPASTKIDNSNHHTVRRDQERACSRMSSSSSSSSSSPFSYPSSTSVSMPLSHPLTSLQSTARANRRSSSGPRDATMVSASRRREERENMHLTLLREEGMEVLKHGRFGCVIPHYRFLFVDREELYWCRREEVGKRKRQQQQQQQQRRGKGSLLLRNLMQVKLKKRARIVSLEFKERSLVVEALGGEEFDVLAGIFTRVMSENMGGNRGPVVITRGKRY